MKVQIPLSKSNALLRGIIFKECLELMWITLSLSGLGAMTLGHAIVILGSTETMQAVGEPK